MYFITKDQMGVSRFECAITGRTSDPEGFFDIGRNLTLIGTDNRPHDMGYRAVVSAAAAKELARMLDWHSPEDIEDLVNRVNAMGAEIAALRHKLDSIETVKRIEAELAEEVAA